MISLSDIAAKKIKKMIQKDGNSALLYLKGGGCNGFSYKFKILQKDEKPNKLDETYKLDNYNIYLCHKSLMFLLGVKIDYIEDIMGSRFDFSNSNIASKCGCGTSVNFI